MDGRINPAHDAECVETPRDQSGEDSMNIHEPKGSRERPLDEVKAEFMKRAGKLNPFEDIKREDAEAVMAAQKNLDKDHWAEEWSKIGLGYEAKGDERAKAGAQAKE